MNRGFNDDAKLTAKTPDGTIPSPLKGCLAMLRMISSDVERTGHIQGYAQRFELSNISLRSLELTVVQSEIYLLYFIPTVRDSKLRLTVSHRPHIKHETTNINDSGSPLFWCLSRIAKFLVGYVWSRTKILLGLNRNILKHVGRPTVHRCL